VAVGATKEGHQLACPVGGPFLLAAVAAAGQDDHADQLASQHRHRLEAAQAQGAVQFAADEPERLLHRPIGQRTSLASATCRLTCPTATRRWVTSVLAGNRRLLRGTRACRGLGLGDRAQVQPGQRPSVAASDGDLGEAEGAVGRLSPIVGLLCLASDRDRGLAVVTHVHLLPHQRAHHQGTGPEPLEPRLLVEHEPQRPDQPEVVGQQQLQRIGTTALLGLGQAQTKVLDLLIGVAGHGGLLAWPRIRLRRRISGRGRLGLRQLRRLLCMAAGRDRVEPREGADERHWGRLVVALDR
jgi:hypothetical protein